MNEQPNKPTVTAAYSLQTATGWSQPELATISEMDIRQPWKSVYGFSMIAARLAAGQELIFHAREDGIFEHLERLNELLGSPQYLNQAYSLLERLEEETLQKLARLVEMREQPIAEQEISELLAGIEAELGEPKEQTLTDRLDTLLSPDDPGKEIPGLNKMLDRVQGLKAALAAVKEQGFQVIVADRRRQARHPALEIHRNQPIVVDGKPSELSAGFLLPPQYHLTLWTYRIVRSDKGQSVVWN